MSKAGKEGQPVPEGEQNLVLPAPELLLLPRWFSALHDVASKFTVETFGEEPEVRAGEEPNNPLKLVQAGIYYRWQWREVSPVKGGEYIQYMEMFLAPDVYEEKLIGEAKIFLFPETGVRIDGRYIEMGDLENRVYWKSQGVRLNAPQSTVERVAGDFGEALSRVWFAIGANKEHAPIYIESLRAEIEKAAQRS